MRRFLFLLLSLTSGVYANFWQDNDKLKVLSTIAMIDDLVKEIASDKIDHITLITGDLDPHSYELVKGDKEKFERADLIFYNGLGLEHGLSLRKQLEANERAIALGDTIVQACPQAILHLGAQADPHIWLDMSLWLRLVDPIARTLAEKDPKNSSHYLERAQTLKEKLRQIDEKCYRRLQAIDSSKRYLVSCHAAFNYFARRYLATEQECISGQWQARTCSPEGLSPEAQISFADLQQVVNFIKEHDVKVLFFESNINADSIKKIQSVAHAEGVEVKLASQGLFADAMGEGSYAEMIEHNVNIISQELQNDE